MRFMSYQIKNFIGEHPSRNINITSSKGPFCIIEHEQDMSVTPNTAIAAYYASEMDVRKRQLVCDLSETKSGKIVLQAGAVQWMLGDVSMTSGIKGVGDAVGKMFKGRVTGETAAKPEYTGSGIVVLEPTYRHLILIDIADWNGAVVLEDGLFLASEGSLKQTIVARSNLSSAIAGGEGFFNLSLKGSAGAFCVESSCPMEELVEITLQDDVLKIDGNYAVAWSAGLEFTVERSGKSLIGSAASGEGLVNVYRGTGKVLMMPLGRMPNI